MLDLIQRDGYNNLFSIDFLMSIFVTYGLYIAIGVLILLVLKQFNKLMSIQVKDVLILLGVLFAIDNIFGFHYLEMLRVGVMKALVAIGGK